MHEQSCLSPDPLPLNCISAGFEHLVALAEVELCGLCDHVEADGTPDSKYTGRGHVLPVVWRRPTPPTAREDGRADPATQALLWLSIRLSELRALMYRQEHCVASSSPLGPLGLGHWKAIVGCCNAPGRNLQALFRCEGHAGWQHRVSLIACAPPGVALNLDTLQAWAAEARAEARSRARAASAAAQKGWIAFVDDQLR